MKFHEKAWKTWNFMKFHEKTWNFMNFDEISWNCHLKAEFDQTHGVCRENMPETKDEGPPGDRY